MLALRWRACAVDRPARVCRRQRERDREMGGNSKKAVVLIRHLQLAQLISHTITPYRNFYALEKPIPSPASNIKISEKTSFIFALPSAVPPYSGRSSVLKHVCAWGTCSYVYRQQHQHRVSWEERSQHIRKVQVTYFTNLESNCKRQRLAIAPC